MSGLIVYGQKDLENALSAGTDDIILCAGIYKIPLVKNTTFRRLGPVKVEVMCSAETAASEGMIFNDIFPEFHSRYAIDSRSSLEPVAAFANSLSSYSSSYGSYNMTTSYGSGSFGSGSGGYYYEYEYEYEYKSSFSGSFAYSYSFSGSFSQSYNISSNNGFELYKTPDTIEDRFIRVFGYGINLI